MTRARSLWRSLVLGWVVPVFGMVLLGGVAGVVLHRAPGLTPFAPVPPAPVPPAPVAAPSVFADVPTALPRPGMPVRIAGPRPRQAPSEGIAAQPFPGGAPVVADLSLTRPADPKDLWLAGFDPGTCAAFDFAGGRDEALPLLAYGLEPISFVAMIAAYQAQFGAELDVVFQTVSPAQCPILTALRAFQSIAPLRLRDDTLAPGQPLEILSPLDPGSTWVGRVGPDGVVRSPDDRPRNNGPHLLIALDLPVDVDRGSLLGPVTAGLGPVLLRLRSAPTSVQVGYFIQQ